MACCYVQQMLDSLIDLYIRLDKVLRNRPSLEGTTLNILAMAPPTPMEISHTRSAHSEYEWRHKKELCFYVCGHLTICYPTVPRGPKRPAETEGASDTTTTLSVNPPKLPIYQSTIQDKDTVKSPRVVPCPICSDRFRGL